MNVEKCVNEVMLKLLYGKKDAMIDIKINSLVKDILKYAAEKRGLTISDVIRLILSDSEIFKEYVKEVCEELSDVIEL